VVIQALGVVESATEELESSTDSGGKDVYMCIQLTDIDMQAEGTPDARGAATMLYGD
jgi:hypothetical protein